MPDEEKNDAMFELAGQVGNLNGTLTQFAKNQEKTNDLMLGFIQAHIKKDDETHGALREDVESLKSSRKVQRALIGVSALGTGGGTAAGIAKVGSVSKLLTWLAAIAGGAGATGGSP